MVNVREVFWSMVRDPSLLVNYVRGLGLDINELCNDELVSGLKCPPSASDDFKIRFFVISYIYLKVLRLELSELDSSYVVVTGVNELISDIITDLRLYDAPPNLFLAIINIARDILHLPSLRA